MRKITSGKLRKRKKSSVNRKQTNRLYLRKKPNKNLKANGQTVWLNRAYKAGQDAALNLSIIESIDVRRELNTHWNHWRIHSAHRFFSWKLYSEMVERYVLGFCDKVGWSKQDWMLIPTTQKVAAIVTVMNEEKTISDVLHQLNRMPLHEIIVVVNGTTDNSFYKIRQQSEAIIVHYPMPLGHDVGRAIGAKVARSDMLLFLDGDFPVFAEHLMPFVHAVDQGKDIALNDISPYLGHFKKRDSVTMVKEFLNRTLKRGDLKANSLTAIPHALSRQAVNTIGYHDLAIPPKAQAKAIQLGLSVASSSSVDVVSTNKQRKELNMGGQSLVADLIVGDHLEALASLMEIQGGRLDYKDETRNRMMAKGGNDVTD